MLSILPSELFVDNIIPQIGTIGVVNFSQISKKMHLKKWNIQQFFIKNDDFLYKFTKFYNIDLIRLISESSFSYTMFDTIYEGIKYNQRIDFKSMINKEITQNETEANYVNNTFRIFQLLKMSIKYNCNITSDSNDVYCDYVISSMKSYFTKLFFLRNPDMKVFTTFFNDVFPRWEISNVNIYYICENMNLICSDKQSKFLDNVGRFDSFILNSNGHYDKDTVWSIYKMFDFNIYVSKMYVIYYIVKYINLLYFKDFKNPIFEKSRFSESILTMIDINETRIRTTHSKILPKYFKDLILKEFQEYISNAGTL